LTEAFLGSGGKPEALSPADSAPAEVKNLEEHNRSWEWIFGRTPDFRFTVGTLIVTVKKGRIQSIEGGNTESTRRFTGVSLKKDELTALRPDIPEELGALYTSLLALAV
jgi:hypothetical protein